MPATTDQRERTAATRAGNADFNAAVNAISDDVAKAHRSFRPVTKVDSTLLLALVQLARSKSSNPALLALEKATAQSIARECVRVKRELVLLDRRQAEGR
jgi:hypothetical protein